MTAIRERWQTSAVKYERTDRGYTESRHMAVGAAFGNPAMVEIGVKPCRP